MLLACAGAGCAKTKPVAPAAPATPSQQPATKVPAELRCPEGSALDEVRTPSGTLKRCRRAEDLRYDGPVVETWANGRLRLQGSLKLNQWDGRFEEWNQAGQPLLVGAFVEDKREGEWTTYRRSADGKTELRSVETYRKDLLEGTPRILAADGRELEAHEVAALLVGRGSPNLVLKAAGADRVALQGARKEGLRDGEWKSFYATGKPSAEVTYRKGIRQGAFRTYWPDGRPAVSGSYEKDKATTILSEDLPSLGETMAELARVGGPVERLGSACGVVLAATKTSQLVALSPTNGHASWKRELGSALLADPVGISLEVDKDGEGKPVKDCLLVLHTADGFVTYVGASSGKEYSKIDAGTTAPISIRSRGVPAGHVVASKGSVLRLLDWRTGKELWRFDAGVDLVGKVQVDTVTPDERSERDFLSVADATGQRRDLREWKKGVGFAIAEGSLGDERFRVPKLPAAAKVVDMAPAEWGHFIITQDKRGFVVTRFLMGGERENDRKGPPSLRTLLSAPRLEVLPLAKRLCLVGQKVVCPRLGDDDGERNDASPNFDRADLDGRWHVQVASGGALVASGKSPASLLFAGATKDHALAPLGRWLLPDVVGCASGLRLAAGGDLRNSLLYLACQGSDQVYAARLSDLDADEGTREANTLWTDAFGGIGAIKLSGGIAYYATDGGGEARVCARDLYSGQPLFCVPWTGVFDVRDGTLFLGAFGRVAAYDALTGDLVWSSEPLVRRLWASWENPKPVPADGVGAIRAYDRHVVHVYRDDWKLELRAYDLRTGATRYQTYHKSLHWEGQPLGAATDLDVVFQDKVIVLVTYGGVHVVDAESGELKTLTEPGDQGIVKVHANTLFLAGSGSVFAYRMSDGKRLWAHRIGRKEKLLRMAVASDDERAVKVHVMSADTEYVLDAKTGKEDTSRGLPDEGETTEDDASDEPNQPYEDEDNESPKSAKLRWVRDGFVGLAVGDGTMAAVDLRRDPSAPELRAGKQAPPKWSPKKLGLAALVGTLKRDAGAEKK